MFCFALFLSRSCTWTDFQPAARGFTPSQIPCRSWSRQAFPFPPGALPAVSTALRTNGVLCARRRCQGRPASAAAREQFFRLRVHVSPSSDPRLPSPKFVRSCGSGSSSCNIGQGSVIVSKSKVIRGVLTLLLFANTLNNAVPSTVPRVAPLSKRFKAFASFSSPVSLTARVGFVPFVPFCDEAVRCLKSEQ